MDPIEIVSATSSVAPIIQQAADYGISNVLVGLMVWMVITLTGLIIWRDVFNSKTLNKMLNELSISVKLQTASTDGLNSALIGIKQSCDNTAKALEIVNTHMNHMSSSLDRMDKKVDFMNNDVKETATLVRRRPCVIKRDGDPNYS